jgi:hypothetical protein
MGKKKEAQLQKINELKKDDEIVGRSMKGREIEVRLFIYHVIKLFPDITPTELKRFIAKYLGLLVGRYTIITEMENISVKGFYLDRTLGEDRERLAKIQKMVERNVKNIGQAVQLRVGGILEDSQQKAKAIKNKMMDEIENRIDTDTECFSNDELIRGSKTMHDIENNTSEDSKVNINILEIVGGLEEFNSKLNELKRRQESTNGQGAETSVIDGEIQEG